MTVVRFPRAGKSDDPDLDPFNLFVALIESVVPVASTITSESVTTLAELLPDEKIDDLRFRVGAVK